MRFELVEKKIDMHVILTIALHLQSLFNFRYLKL